MRVFLIGPRGHLLFLSSISSRTVRNLSILSFSYSLGKETMLEQAVRVVQGDRRQHKEGRRTLAISRHIDYLSLND